jgi:hypothetical protein
LIARVALSLLILAATAFGASAQIPSAHTRIILREKGSGKGPELLAGALAGRHLAIVPAAREYLLRKDSSYSQTVIIVGANVIAEGTVHGDVIVVDGDLTVHPGAQIDGRAVAIGGGVYESALAKTGPVFAFRDFGYDVATTSDGIALSYHANDQYSETPKTIELPGIRGLLVPSYDRSNGLSIPIGIDLNSPAMRVQLTPRLTYRSQLGRVDPWIGATANPSSNLGVGASFGRSTFSNDTWIRSDLINSLHVISFGNDSRNYFRATRGEARLTWFADSLVATRSMYVGVRGEHDLSVRPDTGALGGPWAFRGRDDPEDIVRPNPQIENGKLGSVIVGGAGDWQIETVHARAQLDLELARTTFDSVLGRPLAADRKFGQLTFDGGIEFPTFGMQTLRFDGHAVFTTRGDTPRQRWVYLGGSGTLPPLDLLALGGDQLIFIDSRYNFPIEAVRLPVVNSPLVVTLRDAIGGAAVGRAPAMHQSIGLRLSASYAYVEFMADPATRKKKFGAGLSITR